jgi:hypothetical protein
MTNQFAPILAALALWAAWSSPAAAQDPFIFPLTTDENGRSGQGLAWWLRDSIIRPTETAVSGVSIDDLNRHRDSLEEPWCYASELTPRSFSSPFRAVQAEIEETFREQADVTFRVAADLTGDGQFEDAVVGNYETCGGRVGVFTLITSREEPRRIVFLDERTGWKGLIWLRLEGGVLVIGGCFECGHAEALFYDQRRSRFYWENAGD